MDSIFFIFSFYTTVFFDIRIFTTFPFSPIVDPLILFCLSIIVVPPSLWICMPTVLTLHDMFCSSAINPFTSFLDPYEYFSG